MARVPVSLRLLFLPWSFAIVGAKRMIDSESQGVMNTEQDNIAINRSQAPALARNSKKGTYVWKTIGKFSDIRFLRDKDVQGTLGFRKHGFVLEKSSKLNKLRAEFTPTPSLSWPTSEPSLGILKFPEVYIAGKGTDNSVILIQGTGEDGCCTEVPKTPDFAKGLVSQETIKLDVGPMGVWEGKLKQPFSGKELGRIWESACYSARVATTDVRKVVIPFKALPENKNSDLKDYKEGLLYLKYQCASYIYFPFDPKNALYFHLSKVSMTLVKGSYNGYIPEITISDDEQQEVQTYREEREERKLVAAFLALLHSNWKRGTDKQRNVLVDQALLALKQGTLDFAWVAKKLDLRRHRHGKQYKSAKEDPRIQEAIKAEIEILKDNLGIEEIGA